MERATPIPSAHVQSTSGMPVIQAPLMQPMPLRDALQNAYAQIAGLFAGEAGMLHADKPNVSDYLRAALATPVIKPDGTIQPPEVTLVFGEVLDRLDAMLPPGEALPHLLSAGFGSASLSANRTAPNRHRLAMAALLFAVEAGADAFDAHGRLDMEKFRRFLILHLGQHDAYRSGVPMTAEELRKYVFQQLPLTDAVTLIQRHRHMLRTLPNVPERMSAYLAGQPALRLRQRHAQVMDVTISHAEAGASSPVEVSVPLRAHLSMLLPELQRRIARSLPPRSQARLFETSKPMWKLKDATRTNAQDASKWEDRMQAEWGKFWRSAEFFDSPAEAKVFEGLAAGLTGGFAIYSVVRDELLELIRCAEKGEVVRGHIPSTIGLLIDTGVRQVTMADLQRTRLFSDSDIRHLQAGNVAVWLTAPTILALSAGAQVQVEDLNQLQRGHFSHSPIDQAVTRVIAGHMQEENLSAEARRTLALTCGLPFVHAIVSKCHGLDYSLSANNKRLYEIVDLSLTRSLDAVLTALRGVRPVHLAHAAIEPVFKYILNLQDQELACDTLARFRAHGMLVPRIAESDLERRQGASVPVLVYALDAKKRAVAKWLIAAGSDVHAQDAKGRSALHVAAAAMDAEMVRLLIGKGARFDVADKAGKTPLHEAVRLCDVESLRAMMTDARFDARTRGRLMRSTNAAGRTPVLHALAERNIAAAAFLVSQGADILHVTAMGATALHVWLMAWGARRTEQEDAQMLSGVRTLLEQAAALPEHQRKEWINQAGNFEGSAQRVATRLTPLHFACLYQCHDAVSLLLAQGADGLMRSGSSRTVLELSIRGIGIQRGDDARTVEALWKGLSDAGQWTMVVNAPTDEGITVLRKVIRDLEGGTLKLTPGIKQAMAFLREKGAAEFPAMPASHLAVLPASGSQMQGSAADARALHLASERGDVAEVRALLDRGQVSMRTVDDAGRSALLRAVSVGREAVVDLLLTYRPDLSMADSHGMTALHHAAGSGHLAIARKLLAYDRSVLEVGGGWTALIGSPLEATALHLACGRDHAEMVVLLLEAGAQVAAVNKMGFNVLHYAASAGAVKTLAALQDRYAQCLPQLVVQQDNRGRTPIQTGSETLQRTKSPQQAERVTQAIAKLREMPQRAGIAAEPASAVIATSKHSRDENGDGGDVQQEGAKKRKV